MLKYTQKPVMSGGIALYIVDYVSTRVYIYECIKIVTFSDDMLSHVHKCLKVL